MEGMNENQNDELFQSPLATDVLKWTKCSFKGLDICPQREFDPNKGCGVRKNQCCKNSDCDNPRYFCCIDYCGNRCKSYKLGDAKEKKYQYHRKMSYPFP
ncbi:hypothetical protein AVEN_123349-1 [Araneus ventricosus]|uniref:WAP domain-containing protein n=1 Tax=Araneus ventricosus TaxID=182803 RepID=A0A4Y2NI06_ARAVE|nr:hypothetical protein AVEN_123349-1 [Araneus ventricosus]